MSWRPLGAVLPDRLTEARLQLHYAAQLVSAPGATLLTAQSRHEHTNLTWDAEIGALAGRPVGEASLRAALVFESLELAVLDGRLERASHALPGSTMSQALAWLGQHIVNDRGALSLPAHEMPAHPLADGGSFSEAGGDERTELAAWFADGTAAVHEAVADERRAGPVRCWPHHFDVASLIELDEGEDPEEARTIGVGFSPGDDAYDEPYFYVTPWPYPAKDVLPALPAGATWHTDAWTGAVLLAGQVISERPSRQPKAVQDALRGALAASRALLGA